MNWLINFKLVTMTELFDGLFASDAYKNLIPKHRSLLLEQITDPKEEAGTNHDPDLIEAAATDVAQLITQALGIFKLISESPGDKNEGSDFITMQRALHEYMMKTLYHFNRNCRMLVEAQIDYDRIESLEAHLGILNKKYALVVSNRSNESTFKHLRGEREVAFRGAHWLTLSQ